MLKSLVLMALFFAIAIGAYYVISPYEQCRREQSARLSSDATTSMGVSQKDMFRMLCAKMTNW